jgi:hypothetical protein
VFGSVGAESMVSSSVLNRVDGTPDYQYRSNTFGHSYYAVLIRAHY